MSGREVRVIDDWKSTMPIEIDFEDIAGDRVDVRPESLEFQWPSATPSRVDHPIIRNVSKFENATSTLTFEPQPDPVDPESVVMGWSLHYDQHVEAEAYLQRVTRLMRNPSSLAGDAIPEMSSVTRYMNRHLDLYSLRRSDEIDLLAAVNYRDRLVSVGNAASIRGMTDTIEPVSLSEVALSEQLRAFGNAVATIGHFAIPGIVELETDKAA